jgi:hypothetical protein
MIVGTSLASKGAPGAALVQNATDAVKQWRFQPAIVNGAPISAPLTVLVSFQLDTGVASTVLDLPEPKPVAPKVRQ